MNNTTKYYSLIIAVVVLFAMMTVSCEKSPVDKGTDETDRMIDIRTSIEALTKSPALDGNGEGNFFIVVVDYYYGGVVLVEPAVGNIAVARVQRLD